MDAGWVELEEWLLEELLIGDDGAPVDSDLLDELRERRDGRDLEGGR